MAAVCCEQYLLRTIPVNEVVVSKGQFPEVSSANVSRSLCWRVTAGWQVQDGQGFSRLTEARHRRWRVPSRQLPANPEGESCAQREYATSAARSGAGDAIKAVRDGGRLATITADPPAAERGITVREVQVAPDGARLGELARLAAQGVLAISSTRSYPLEQAGTALALARHGAHGAAVILRTGRDDGGPR